MASLFLFSRNRLPYFSNDANTLAIKINRFIPPITILANYYKCH